MRFFICLLFAVVAAAIMIGCGKETPVTASAPEIDRVHFVEGTFDTMVYDSNLKRWTIEWEENGCYGAVCYIRAHGASTWMEYPFECNFHFQYGVCTLGDKNKSMAIMPWQYRIVFIY